MLPLSKEALPGTHNNTGLLWLVLGSLTDTWLRDLGAETPASKGSQVGRPQHLAVGLKCLWFDLEKKQKVGSSKRQVGFV